MGIYQKTLLIKLKTNNMKLQEYIKSINPKSTILIYNSQYHCWRDDEYIGIYTWTKDELVGDSFQRINNNEIEIAIPTKIVLKKQI